MRSLFTAFTLAAVIAAFPFASNAQYDLDGSQFALSGQLNYVVTLPLVAPITGTDQPIVVTCPESFPLSIDGDPTTISMSLNLANLSGGLITQTFVATGTLNPTTGVFSARINQSGLTIPISYTDPASGITLNLTVRSIDLTLAGTVSGNQVCFIGGQWRRPGGVITGNPTTSAGIIRGTVNTLFNPPWNMTISNIRWSGALCSCPGVPVSGRVTFEEAAALSNRPVTITARSGNTSEQFQINVPADGSYSITLNRPGSVELFADAPGFLRSRRVINTNNGGATNVNFSLRNGDTDDSGAIDDADLTNIILDFGATGGSSSGFRTDFNEDGVVDDGDLTILILNFGETDAQ